MSGIGSTGSAGSTGSQTFGTNVPPVSFPGIASGLDYNSIIAKYTALTLAQSKPLQDKVTRLNAAQAELLKIQDLIAKLQDTFQKLSDPANFNATTATSSNPSAMTLSNVPNATATPGTYTIKDATLATSTQIVNDPAANNTALPLNTVLANAGTSITPSNGNASDGNGHVTINGVTITYNVNSDTFTSLQNKISVATGGTVTLSNPDVTGRVTLTSTNGPLTIGGPNDSGNILAVLKLDQSPIAQTGPTTYSVTSASPVDGINVGATMNTNQNAGFTTAVTAGTFTINGVAFSVDPAVNNLNDLLQKINNSTAGVIASYDAANDRITLTAKANGPSSIALGSSTDTSNFLQAAGFLTTYNNPSGGLSGGATLSVGQAAKVDYYDAAGNLVTAYSNSNDVTNVVPGIDIKLLQAIAAPTTVTVSQDSSGLQGDIKSFVDAYNAVMDEINTATQAPVVGASTDASTGQQQSNQLTQGGVLFNNQDVLSLRDQLVNLVSSLGNTGSTSYNSLASVGLVLDSSFSVQTASASNTNNSTNQNNVTTQTFAGTSGRLQDLDVSKLSAALAANPNAVAQLFTGASSVIGNLGAYLTSVTGLPTQLTGGMAGSIPSVSLISSLTAEDSDQIGSLQQQIQLVTDQANLQADALRQQFVAAETMIAQLQAVQSSLGSLSSKSGG